MTHVAYRQIALLLVLFIMLSVSGNAHAGFLLGSTFSVAGTDSPTNFSENVVLSPGTTTLDGGLITLTQTITPIGSSDWLNLSFQTTQGLLASNTSGFWEMNVSGVQLSSPAEQSAIMIYWTVDGVPTEPINPFLVFSPVEANPLSPSGQDAYIAYSNFGIGSTAGEEASISPYYQIRLGGMDPNAVNGVDMAIQITPSVPEPSTLVLAVIGAVILGFRGTENGTRLVSCILHSPSTWTRGASASLEAHTSRRPGVQDARTPGLS